jgi:TRAP-type mannitol/chloroaromatic compound transport system permease small subunit
MERQRRHDGFRRKRIAAFRSILRQVSLLASLFPAVYRPPMETFREAIICGARRADLVTQAACLALLAVLAVSQLSAVFLRYFLGQGFIWLGDVASWSFAGLVVLAMPVALARDANIRVDAFVEDAGDTFRTRIDVAAILLLLVPMFLLIVATAWPQMIMSWRIQEASPQIGGIPGYFLIRSLPVVGALLMVLQGLARIARLSRPT